MKYLTLIAAIIFLSACGDTAANKGADHSDTTEMTDSMKRVQEEEEMSEEIIEGSFDALNR